MYQRKEYNETTVRLITYHRFNKQVKDIENQKYKSPSV